MGLPVSYVRWLLREYKRRGLPRSVLTLGRQHMAMTPDQAVALMEESGIAPLRKLRGQEDLATHSTLGAALGHISDRAFFELLGVPLQSLDNSDYEGADLVHDLNHPVPVEWHGRFDQILDSGTTEHIFDVRQSLKNVGDMLAVGGEVIHLLPANNFVNHGFYQFSPCLFFDYYCENRYKDLRGFIGKELSDFPPSSAELFALDPNNLREIRSAAKLLILFSARKQEISTSGASPQQAKWAREFSGVSQQLNRSAPGPIRLLLRRIASRLYRVLPWLGPSRREPWGHSRTEVLSYQPPQR